MVLTPTAKTAVAMAISLLFMLISHFFTSNKVLLHPISVRNEPFRIDAFDSIANISSRAPKTYDEAIIRGEELMDLLKKGPLCVSQSEWTEHSMLKQYGWVSEDPWDPEIPPEGSAQSIAAMYDEYGWSAEDDDNTILAVRHLQNSEPIGPEGKVYRSSRGRYISKYNPKVITAIASYGPEYYKKLLEAEYDLVPLRQWSDVTFLTWAKYCENDIQKMRAIEGMVQKEVANEETIRRAEQALEKKGEKLKRWGDGPTVWYPGEEGFHALLATPNGNGVAWFLANHKMKLGRLTIARITAFRGMDSRWPGSLALNLLFSIGRQENAPEDFDEDSTDKPDAGELTLRNAARESIEVRSAARTLPPKTPVDVDRSGDSSAQIFKRTVRTFDEAVQNGEALLKAISDDSICSVGGQSQYVETEALKKHGWVESTSHNEAPLTAWIKAMYDEYGWSQKNEDNTVKYMEHIRKSQPIGPEDTIYKPTSGRYNCLYNPNLIIIRNAFGPDHLAKQKNIASDEVIPLKQWSDVVFLKWAEYCNNDHRKMRDLQGILAKEVVNDVSRERAEEALRRKGEQLNTWPDGPTTWTPEEDGFKALLSTPNGNGVAWFLAQHKEQLGRLTVTKITAFKGVSFFPELELNLLFTIGWQEGSKDFPEFEPDSSGDEDFQPPREDVEMGGTAV